MYRYCHIYLLYRTIDVNEITAVELKIIFKFVICTDIRPELSIDKS